MIIIASGILLATGIYLLLEKSSIRRVFGVIVIGNAINLMILIGGRFIQGRPAFIQEVPSEMSNPLPQALILTAIVITLGLTAFLVTLLKRSSEDSND